MTAAGILWLTLACSSLRPVWDPARFIAETKPPVVYVMKGRDAVLTIANPRVSGDTVHGTVPGEDLPVALPLRDVQNIGTVRLNGGRSALLAAGITLVSAFAAYAFLGNANGRHNWYCDYNDSVRGPNGEPLCGPTEP